MLNKESSRAGGRLSARRFVLLGTTVLAFGAGAFLSNPDVTAPAFAQNVTQQAQTVQRPIGFADVVEKVKPAVISVRVKVNGGAQLSSDEGGDMPRSLERFFRRFGGSEDMLPNLRGQRRMVTGQGSGFFISADGYAVTNNHVVEKADSVEVTADDGKTYTAKVIGTDPRTDLALIKVDGRTDFPFAVLSDKQPRIGDWVLAVGNPFGLGGSVTAGIVSARGRDIGAGPYDDFLQIDAPVNKGNSGGPTFDIDGHVVGVNTAIFSPSGGSVGIAFAIPASTVTNVITQLRENGSVTRGWIGVQIQQVTPEIAESIGLKDAKGALVAEPQKNSPAAQAGIQAGDVITRVNGEPVRNARDLAKRIGAIPPGTSVKIDLWRNGGEKNVTLTLGELPKQQQARAEAGSDSNSGNDIPRLGLTLVPATGVAGGGSEGVVVTQVDPAGVAADQGLKTGDVILQVGGVNVNNPNEVQKAIADARSGGKQRVLMRVKTGDGTRFVTVPVARG